MCRRFPELAGWWLRTARAAEVAPPCRLEELFLEQVRRNASRPAVITPSMSMTYEELEKRSRSVALKLRDIIGPRPGAIVAVTMQRGWEQVAAVLGVLRAGAAYAPVDPALPRERLHHLLSTTGAAVTLTQSWLDANIPWPARTHRIAVDILGTAGEQPLIASLDVSAEDVAYVIFTSGSSGLPKGVAITHRSAAHTILTINEMGDVGASDRMLGVASLSFDLSVYDIFGMLAAGGALVMPASSVHPDPAHWAALMEQAGVTLWNSVPAHLQLLLESGAGPRRTVPRLIMLSGDWIPLSLPARARSAFGPATRILAMGGATEAAIWSIFKWVDQVQPNWTAIPYGTPLAGQDVLVLDESLEKCPSGATGELYIAGEGVALGYWLDPVRTAQSFVPDPRTGQRLYRTGDLGRYRPDGEIDLLGRRDTQVKISGYRVDLGEVEFALLQHPDVREAAVVAPGAAGERAALVAYVVGADPSCVRVDGLHELLKQKLPAYALPRHIHMLDRLPLTSNGKVDRKALAERRPDEPVDGYCAPRNALEQSLADVFGEVLDRERVGIHDNFFELGGTSILAMQLVADIQAQFAVSWPLRVIFEVPHVAGLAERIVQDTIDGADSHALADALEAVEK
jgi:amino acid adenylation domain-containing protein